jgi:hypothetical protein
MAIAIHTVTPRGGKAGTTVVVDGEGFGPLTGTVTLDGVAAVVSAWSDSQITFDTPVGTSENGSFAIRAVTQDLSAFTEEGFWIPATNPLVDGLDYQLPGSETGPTQNVDLPRRAEAALFNRILDRVIVGLGGLDTLAEILAGGNTTGVDPATSGTSIIVSNGDTIDYSDSLGVVDVGLSRDSAGYIKVTDGSTGTGGLKLKDGTGTGDLALSFVSSGSTGLYRRTSGVLGLMAGGSSATEVRFDIGFFASSSRQYSFGAVTGSSPDAGLVRDSAGVVKVTDGSTGDGNLSLGTGGEIRFSDVGINRNAAGVIGLTDGAGGSGASIATVGDYVSVGGKFIVQDGANVKTEVRVASIDMSSDSSLRFSNSTINVSTLDVGIARDSAGILKVTDGSTGLGSIIASEFIGDIVTDALVLDSTNKDIRLRRTGAITAEFDNGAGSGIFLNMAGTFAIDGNIIRKDGGGNSVIALTGSTPSGVMLASPQTVSWSSSATNVFAPKDIALVRDSAGVLKVTDGSSGVGAIKFEGFRIPSTSVDILMFASGNSAILDAPNIFFTQGIGIGGTGYPATGAVNGTLNLRNTTDVPKIFADTLGVDLADAMTIDWSSTTNATGTKDVGLKRDSTNTLKVTDGSTGLGDIIAGNMTSNGLPVATVLARVTGIDAKVIGTTNLYTVPAGKICIVQDVIIRATFGLASATSVAGVGIAPGEDDIFPSQTLTGLLTTGDVYKFSLGGKSLDAAAGEIIKLGIDTGATATVQSH